MSTYIEKGKRLEYDNAPDWLVRYMEHRLSVLNDTPNTIMTYFIALREFFQWVKYRTEEGEDPEEETLRNVEISNMPITLALDVMKPDIEKYMYFLTDTLRNEASTRGKKLVTVRGFYDFLIDQQDNLGIEYDTNPAARIRTPKMPQKQPVFLTAEEQNRLLANISGENAVRDFAMTLTFLSTGVRVSEIVNLNLKDIRKNQMQIVIRSGKGKKDRRVPLTLPCLMAIEQYIEEYRDPIQEKLDTDALFISKRFKKRMTTRAVEKTLDQQFIKAGLQDVSVHKLRHSAATTYVKDGVDLPIIQKIMGHSSPHTTEIYIHLDDSDVKKAIRNSSVHLLGDREYLRDTPGEEDADVV